MAPYQSGIQYQPTTQTTHTYHAYIPRFHHGGGFHHPANGGSYVYTPVTAMSTQQPQSIPLTNPQSASSSTSSSLSSSPASSFPPSSSRPTTVTVGTTTTTTVTIGPQQSSSQSPYSAQISITSPPPGSMYHHPPPPAPRRSGPHLGHPPQVVRQNFRSKSVCLLTCKHCEAVVCRRGMKAILLADTTVELFSTDVPPVGVQLVQDDYQTRNCQCRIRDVACLGCGNVIGYHVTQPCPTCMEACNNGHFWMFHIDQVAYSDRLCASGTSKLVWAHIPRPEKDMEQMDPYDHLCR